MTPAIFPLQMTRGEPFFTQIAWVNPVAGRPLSPGAPIDLTGCVGEFTVSLFQDGPTLLSLTSNSSPDSGASLSLLGSTGLIQITIPSDVILSWPVPRYYAPLLPMTGYYTLGITDSAQVSWPVAAGNLPIYGE